MSTPATKPIITPSNSLTPTVRIGTRQSQLALRQAQWVAEALQRQHPDIKFEIRKKDTTGDKDKVTALYKFGGQGLWTNELEAELVTREVDFVVHSLKDMPTNLPAGCVLASVPEREDPRDVVVVRRALADRHRTLADLPAGSVVGTSSVRRMAQIRRRYPALRFEDMRGNLDTRLRKLDADDSPYAALILAAAGLRRMGLADRATQHLHARTEGGGMLHAVGQGGLGLEARADDEPTLALLRGIQDDDARLAAETERSVMRTLEGGCSVPIGVETEWVGSESGAGSRKLRIAATVVSVDGTEAADAEQVAEVRTVEEAVAFGLRVAQQLRDAGAQKILDVINAEREATRDDAKPWIPA